MINNRFKLILLASKIARDINNDEKYIINKNNNKFYKKSIILSLEKIYKLDLKYE